MEDLEARTENNDKFKEELKKELKEKRRMNTFLDGGVFAIGAGVLVGSFLPKEYFHNPIITSSVMISSLAIGYILAFYYNKPGSYEKRKDLQ